MRLEYFDNRFKNVSTKALLEQTLPMLKQFVKLYGSNKAHQISVRHANALILSLNKWLASVGENK